MSKRDKSINTVFKADGWKMKTNGMGNDVLSLWGFSGTDKNVWKFDCGDGCITLCYTTNHWTARPILVNCMTGELKEVINSQKFCTSCFKGGRKGENGREKERQKWSRWYIGKYWRFLTAEK